jgi:hypothetical protein
MLALNVPTASSRQRGNAFVSRQMTTENVGLRNSSLIDTIDAKNLCQRHKYDAVSNASVIY